MFGAAGEHAVGLGGAQRDQIIHQHADIGLVACRAPGRFIAHRARGIDAGQQALGAGFFVPGGAVDLAGEIQAGDIARFQRAAQVARVEVVVFDGIAGARDMRLLEAGDAAYESLLHVEGQRGGNTVGVDLARVQAFGLDEDLVRALVRETMNLVFYRRAVAWAGALDGASEHRRAVQVLADDLVRAFVGVGDPARDLLRMVGAAADVAEYRPRLIAGLLLELAVVDAAPVQSRRRAGLQAAHAQGQRPQTLGQRVGGRVTGATAGALLHAHMDAAAQKCAHGQHHGAGP